MVCSGCIAKIRAHISRDQQAQACDGRSHSRDAWRHNSRAPRPRKSRFMAPLSLPAGLGTRPAAPPDRCLVPQADPARLWGSPPTCCHADVYRCTRMLSRRIVRLPARDPCLKNPKPWLTVLNTRVAAGDRRWPHGRDGVGTDSRNGIPRGQRGRLPSGCRPNRSDSIGIAGICPSLVRCPPRRPRPTGRNATGWPSACRPAATSTPPGAVSAASSPKRRRRRSCTATMSSSSRPPSPA